MICETKMTGNRQALRCIKSHIKQFHDQRRSDKQLRSMQLYDYTDEKGLTSDQIKILIITGTKAPYKNKLIKIRIEFDDDYPRCPPKMYVEKCKNGVPFLHANVYHDLGDICHQLLGKKEKEQQKIPFTFILKKIQQLLYTPNFNNPANIVLKNLRQSNLQKYEESILQNASLLQDAEGSYLGEDDDGSQEQDS